MVARRKILITGCRGQLGTDLVRVLSDSFDVTGTDLPQTDITDRSAISRLLDDLKPETIIHAAAYTDVDGCESNRELAMKINGEGARILAHGSNKIGARMIFYSTDYVFDGKKPEPYVETDQTGPATVYGQSKLAGELAVQEECADHAIIRIAWVYGRHGKNFVQTMLKLGQEQIRTRQAGGEIKPLTVVDDQFGNPTWTEEIANQTVSLIESGERGVFHATSEGVVSWYQFANDVFGLAGLNPAIERCSSDQFPRPAKRPRNSALENSRLKQLGCHRMRPYIEPLKQYLKSYRENR